MTFRILAMVILIAVPTISFGSELYFWTDENGVRHYTNIPPEKAEEKLDQVPEIPHDEDADEERMKDYYRWQRQNSREIRQIQREREREAAEEEAEKARIAEEEAKAREEAARKAKEAEEAKKSHWTNRDKRKSQKRVFRRPASPSN